MEPSVYNQHLRFFQILLRFVILFLERYLFDPSKNEMLLKRSELVKLC
jgi:hypothetical protein